MVTISKSHFTEIQFSTPCMSLKKNFDITPSYIKSDIPWQQGAYDFLGLSQCDVCKFLVKLLTSVTMKSKMSKENNLHLIRHLIIWK